jgi:hypothetical protein
MQPVPNFGVYANLGAGKLGLCGWISYECVAIIPIPLSRSGAILPMVPMVGKREVNVQPEHGRHRQPIRKQTRDK